MKKGALKDMKYTALAVFAFLLAGFVCGPVFAGTDEVKMLAGEEVVIDNTGAGQLSVHQVLRTDPLDPNPRVILTNLTREELAEVRGDTSVMSVTDPLLVPAPAEVIISPPPETQPEGPPITDRTVTIECKPDGTLSITDITPKGRPENPNSNCHFWVVCGGWDEEQPCKGAQYFNFIPGENMDIRCSGKMIIYNCGLRPCDSPSGCPPRR